MDPAREEEAMSVTTEKTVRELVLEKPGAAFGTSLAKKRRLANSAISSPDLPHQEYPP
jgi:hypothetical protein